MQLEGKITKLLTFGFRKSSCISADPGEKYKYI